MLSFRCLRYVGISYPDRVPDGWEVAVPQELACGSTKQALCQAARDAGQSDAASLHTAETCLHCTRAINPRDGMPIYMEDTLLGYLHPDCADAWRANLLEYATMRRRA